MESPDPPGVLCVCVCYVSVCYVCVYKYKHKSHLEDCLSAGNMHRLRYIAVDCIYWQSSDRSHLLERFQGMYKNRCHTHTHTHALHNYCMQFRCRH